MRSIVRPFIIEYKTRSPKSLSQLQDTTDVSAAGAPKPGFLDGSDFFATRSGHFNGYAAAMKAADAVFARIAPAAPALGETPPSVAPVGRVLPSLIESVDPLAIQLPETDDAPRRSPVKRKTGAASPVPPKIPPVAEPQGVTMLDSLEPVTTKAPADISVDATPDRERRSVRKRRLLDAALKPGETWKRRLSRSAR
jgi:hypothetical protein